MLNDDAGAISKLNMELRKEQFYYCMRRRSEDVYRIKEMTSAMNRGIQNARKNKNS